jgi:hypothetical protein
MEALTIDDLVPFDEFAANRREAFSAHLKYLDRYRRVRIGPRLMLVFENRQTLWFRVQEVLRIARLSDANQIQQQLDLSNRLLPGANRLQAALLLQIDESRLREELAPWQSLRGEQLRLHLGPVVISANLLTARPEDRCIGAAHWVQFVVGAEVRELLNDARVPVHVEIALPEYRHSSGILTEEVRQSLRSDLG